MVKNLPDNAGGKGLSAKLQRSPEAGNGNLSSILAWEILWTEEPGRLQYMCSRKVGHN